MKRCLSFCCIALIIAGGVLGTGCVQRVVIGSPYERYDHNRTLAISIAGPVDLGCLVGQGLRDEMYIPFGSGCFPTAEYAERSPGRDRLPAANLVPIFTGVSLPLSQMAQGNGESDRDDLIDFLAQGPRARHGIERGATMGDRVAAAATYRPVLEILGSEEALSGGRDAILRRLSPWEPKIADEIVDGRYSLVSFADSFSFLHGEFWFVLYQLAGGHSYSRLVVVPAPERGQDFPGKRP